MTAIENTSTNTVVSFDHKSELRSLAKLGKAHAGNLVTFGEKASAYVAQAELDRNLDLCRVMFLALATPALQAKYTAWLTTVLPVKKVMKDKQFVSFKIDRKRTQKNGWSIQDNQAFSVGFLSFKKPKPEKSALGVEELLKAIQKRIDAAGEAIDPELDDARLASASEALRVASLAIEALVTPATPTGQDMTNIAQGSARIITLTSNTDD